MKHNLVIMVFLTTVALAFGATRLVYATHGQLHVYMADDPAKQDSGLPGTENYVNWWWGLVDNGAIGWWADPNNPSFKADVVTALRNWTTPIPQLLWQEKPTPDPSETGVVISINHCFENALACIKVTNATNQSPHNASYWWRAEVKIDPDHGYGQGARAAAITHELGHLYGLHERYFAGSGCNASEFTIMDFFIELPAPGSNIWWPCDAFSPASIDMSRVQSYWSQGQPAELSLTSNGGSVATARWKDEAWADSWHFVAWCRCVWDTCTWVPNAPAASQWTNNNLGVHRITEQNMGLPDRVLTINFDRASVPAPQPAAGFYTACVWPWFWPNDNFVTILCAPAAVWLN